MCVLIQSPALKFAEEDIDHVFFAGKFYGFTDGGPTWRPGGGWGFAGAVCEGVNCEVCEVGEPETGVMKEEREDGDGE